MYECNHRITYYDLDFRGQVKLSAILRMVHIAADVNANELGIGFAVLHPLNISFVLQRFGLKITRMPVYDEVVTIRTWPAEMARGTFIRKGDMYSQIGEKLMEWASLWILFDIAERKILKPSALPVEVPTMTEISVNISPEKIVLPDNLQPLSEHIHTVRYADIDTNMHMNNSIYGDLIGNAAFHNLDSNSQNWHEVQINYLGETLPGDEIKITAAKGSDTCFIAGYAGDRCSFTAKIIAQASS